MMLNDSNLSYILFYNENIEELSTILYNNGYNIIPIKEYFNGNYKKSIITNNQRIDNNNLRRDAIYLLETLKINDCIIKYHGETNVNKLYSDGSEKIMDIEYYPQNSSSPYYILESTSFSFRNKKRYFKPKNINDFKIGMVVEYLNNNKWNRYEVTNPKKDYDDFFKLLMKYDKVRIPSQSIY